MSANFIPLSAGTGIAVLRLRKSLRDFLVSIIKVQIATNYNEQ